MRTMKSVCFPPYRLDFAEQRLWRGAEEIQLRAKTFAVLCELVEHAGRLVTKEELLEVVWPGTYVCDVAPMVCVWEIRKALGQPGETWVTTVHRRGYRFVGRIDAAVEAVPPEPRRTHLCSECAGRSHSAHPGSRQLRSASRGRRRIAEKT